jgi:hypothetical protein
MDELNEIARKETIGLQDLNEKERKMVELRYFGETYPEIAKVVNYSESYLRKLFMSGGRLATAYDEFAAIQRAKSNENVDQALVLAKSEAVNALQRIIELSKNAKTEGGLYKANELLLQLSGVNEGIALRTYLMGKTYEQAQKLIDDLFRSIFGKGVGIQNIMPMIQVEMADGTWKPMKYNIGTPDEPKQLPEPEQPKE